MKSGQRIKLRRRLLCCLGDKPAAGAQGFTTSGLSTVAAGAGRVCFSSRVWPSSGALPTTFERQRARRGQGRDKPPAAPAGQCKANCLLTTSLLPFFLNTGSSPHKREHLSETLMTLTQPCQRSSDFSSHLDKVSIPQRSSRIWPTVASVRPPQPPTA